MLKAILQIIAAWFQRRNSPEAAKAKRQKVREEIEGEVRNGDVGAMNRRLKKQGVIKVVFLPFVLAFLLAGCGSVPEVVYVNEAEAVDVAEVGGQEYVLVPVGVYVEMVCRIENCTCQ